MRMASEMLRPAVVNFLDVMLRREDLALRIEELAVPASMVGRQLDALELHRFRKLLLLAVRTGDGWSYNPQRDYVMRAGETLVFMGSPEERVQLESTLRGRRRARGERGLTGYGAGLPASGSAASFDSRTKAYRSRHIFSRRR